MITKTVKDNTYNLQRLVQQAAKIMRNFSLPFASETSEQERRFSALYVTGIRHHDMKNY